jgi:membrane protein
MKLKDLWGLLKETYQEWSEDKAPRLAAALSYYTIFSLAPLLVIVIAIAGLVFGQAAAQNRINVQIEGLIGQPGASAIQAMIASASNPRAGIIATVIGIVTLLLGAAGLFGQLQDSLNTIWEIQTKPEKGLGGLIKKRFLSFTMVLGIGFLLLVSLVITAALSALDNFTTQLFPGFELVFQVVNFLISFGVITLLFAMIYKILPDAKLGWRDVWLGAAVTALLFSIGKLLIGLYLGHASVTSSFGAAGSLVVVLLWIYYSAQILFFGAEFTQVYARRYGSGVVPEAGAIRLTEEQRAQQGMPHREAVERAAAIGTSVAVAGKATAEAGTRPARQPVRPAELLPEARPSLLALSAILSTLVGFISGMVVTRGNGRRAGK